MALTRARAQVAPGAIARQARGLASIARKENVMNRQALTWLQKLALPALLFGLTVFPATGCDRADVEEAVEEGADEVKDAAKEVRDEIDDHTRGN